MVLNLHEILFYLLAAVALGSAFGVIASKNPVHSALSLVLTLFSIAGFYLLLSASFLAVIQVLTYAGAILVLFIFIIMLLNLEPGHLLERHPATWMKFLLAATASVLMLALTLIVTLSPRENLQNREFAVDVFSLGKELFTAYVLPFEVAGILLTVALIAAVFLAKKHLVEEEAA